MEICLSILFEYINSCRHVCLGVKGLMSQIMLCKILIFFSVTNLWLSSEELVTEKKINILQSIIYDINLLAPKHTYLYDLIYSNEVDKQISIDFNRILN